MSNILYPSFELQAVFSEPILSAEHFDPGYSGHATDVWKVTTARRTVAVRVSRFEHWGGSPFWDGLSWLFGWRPVTAHRTQARHNFLRPAGGLPVPRMLGHGQVGETGYLVMESMPGQRCGAFEQFSPAGLEAYGQHLASLHAHQYPHTGAPGGAKGYPAAQFPARLAAVLDRLAFQYYQEQPELTVLLGEMRERALALRISACAPVLVDLDPTQYLVDENGFPCALIDTDAYVLAPRDLDLISLEYLLTPEQATHFIRGYAGALPLPDLSEVRLVYRYLYFLMEVHGIEDLEECMGWPAIF